MGSQADRLPSGYAKANFGAGCVMEVAMDRLPSRFPVGTRYVVEGRGGGEGRFRVHSRYLEFPDGRQIALPVDLADRTRSHRRRQPAAARNSR